MQYTELQVTSNFSFLQGASHPEELVAYAKHLGYTAIAITDVNTMAGIVRAYVAAKKNDIRLVVGCHLVLKDGASVLAYPINKQGYTNICTLLSTGNIRTEKGQCELYVQDVLNHLQHNVLVVIPPATLTTAYVFDNDFIQQAKQYKKVFGAHVYLAITRRYTHADAKLMAATHQLATLLQMPLVATNNVFYHKPSRRKLQDVLVCIKEKCTIYNAGFKLYPNAERYLKPTEEMLRLFRQYPEAVAATQTIVNTCTFSLQELQYQYPEEITVHKATPQEELVFITWQHAKEIYGETIPAKVRQNIQYELKFIGEMEYAAYFLTVYDIVKFARSKNILCQGRGSAANSTVCYCLGITSVDPAKFDLLFERFLSAARNEPPDIDVDFEHERREEVIQYIYEKYGRDRAAIVATVTQQHQKGALRDVAKAMGLSVDTINKLSATIHRMSSSWFTAEMLEQAGLDIADVHLQKTLTLAKQFLGFPRQLGQHTGGFVISRQSITQLCPILNARMQNRTCIEWNKDDIEALGFLKIDVLALGMLTCIRKALDILKSKYHIQHTLASIPQEVPEVYDMICKADTIGVFQIESRAQQSMLPRLKPRCFYDLVIEVAIVRPGPIQGDMVHPYLRRRNGEEQVEYPSEELRSILQRTLGVPLFQEQAMKIAIVAAGFSPAEADELRRSMATFKVKGQVTKLQQKLITGMINKGYTPEYASRVFKQLEGFGSYGFPESHAASFAQLVYVSCWLKCFYPDVFACALLNSLPMGFYQPAQIVIDAQNHGVTVLPVDVNFSGWNHSLENKIGNYYALRLGFRQIKGISEAEANLLVAKRTKPITGLYEIMVMGLQNHTIELLAEADAFQSLELNRREALWQLSITDKPTALFNQYNPLQDEPTVQLPSMPAAQQVVQDYATTALSLKAHPVSFIRQKLAQLHITPNAQLGNYKNLHPIRVAGLVLVRQRPSTAKGVWFITLEDETGITNIVVFANTAAKYKVQITQARLLMLEGTLQIEGSVIHVIAKQCWDASKMLNTLMKNTTQHLPALSRADEVVSMHIGEPPMVQRNLFSEPRDFR